MGGSRFDGFTANVFVPCSVVCGTTTFADRALCVNVKVNTRGNPGRVIGLVETSDATREASYLSPRTHGGGAHDMSPCIQVVRHLVQTRCSIGKQCAGWRGFVLFKCSAIEPKPLFPHKSFMFKK